MRDPDRLTGLCGLDDRLEYGNAMDDLLVRDGIGRFSAYRIRERFHHGFYRVETFVLDDFRLAGDVRIVRYGDETEGVETRIGAYLATFTFRSSPDAAGVFTLGLLHDDQDPAQRTFLFPTPAGAKIEVKSVIPAVIRVKPPAPRRSG